MEQSKKSLVNIYNISLIEICRLTAKKLIKWRYSDLPNY